MSDKIINTDTMIGKVISIMIALLFVVILAFPVANSLSNQGSGGGDSETITYTNTGDFYYKSATADSSEHTLTVDYTLLFDEEDELNDTIELNILLDDVSIYAHTFENVNDNYYESATPLLLAYNDEGYLTIWAGKCVWMPNTGMYPIDEIWMDSSDTYLDNGNNILTTLTIQNGELYYLSDGNENSLNIDYFLSDDGDYVMADAPAYVLKENTEIYVYDYDSNIFCSISGQFNSSDIHSNTQSLNGLVQVSGITWNTLTDASYSGTLTSVTEGSFLELEYIDSEYSYMNDGNESTGSKQTTHFIVPTTVTATPSNTHTVTYTNSGDYYYKSATADSSEHIIDIEYTEINGESTSFTTVLKIDGTTILNQSLGRGADRYYLFGWNQTQTIGLSIQDGYMWIMNNADNTSEQMFGTWTEEIHEHGYTIYAQYVISDGVLSFTDDENIEHSYSIDYYMSGTGEYVLADMPIVSASDNTPIKLWINCIAEDIHFSNPLTFSIYGTIESGDIVSDTESISLNVNAKLGDVISNSIESTLTSSKVGDLITLDNVSCEGNITTESNTTYYGSASSTQFIVPTTVTVEEEGGDSDSGSIGSVASTLIKLVPILLIVGILLIFVIPMINGKVQ